MIGFSETLSGSCGLDLLDLNPPKTPLPENWLQLEAEIRKYQTLIKGHNKIACVFSKKMLSNLFRDYTWPDVLASQIQIIIEGKAVEEDFVSTLYSLKKLYFEELPSPSYWEYESLINKLHLFLLVAREKDWKTRLDKILCVVDKYQWPEDIRYQLEDLKELTLSVDVIQKVKSIQKHLKKKQPLPFF
ncbi:MAG: hypothetical protein PVI40_05205 [Chlamydiota bacterium]|jgi:hypothetical protein